LCPNDMCPFMIKGSLLSKKWFVQFCVHLHEYKICWLEQKLQQQQQQQQNMTTRSLLLETDTYDNRHRYFFRKNFGYEVLDFFPDGSNANLSMLILDSIKFPFKLCGKTQTCLIFVKYLVTKNLAIRLKRYSNCV